MTEQRSQKQDDDHVNLPDKNSDSVLEAAGAMFKRRQKAVANCHNAVRAMAQETNTLVKNIIAQVHEVTKHESIPLFAMMPEPDSEDFAIRAVAFRPGFEMVKAKWSYEILYNVGAPLEEAFECITQAQFRLKEEVEKPGASRKLAARGGKSVAESDILGLQALLKRVDTAVELLDRLSEKIGAERYQVDEDFLHRFDSASKDQRTQMVDQAWKAAKGVWGKPRFRVTPQGKQLRMLRVLQRYDILEPILKPWSKMLEATEELRECCSK